MSLIYAERLFLANLWSQHPKGMRCCLHICYTLLTLSPTSVNNNGTLKPTDLLVQYGADSALDSVCGAPHVTGMPLSTTSLDLWRYSTAGLWFRVGYWPWAMQRSVSTDPCLTLKALLLTAGFGELWVRHSSWRGEAH